MITKAEYESVRQRTLAMFDEACIKLTPEEAENIEVADFGLNDLERTGLEIVTYINTDRVCAKELVMFPNQTCPEHRHPPIEGIAGKEETFRCRWGEVYVYIPGRPTENPHCKPPSGDEPYYTVFHEIALKPGEQYTLAPSTPHWFQASESGAIVSEFSTTSRDAFDIFTDPRIIREMEMI